MNPRNINQRIIQFNSQRPATLCQRKYAAMKEDPSSFFRGSCHLFHTDWPVGTKIDRAPQLFICGDLHLGNFGTYKGSDRQVYFGINDFDEGVYAPITRDITRLAVSVLLVAKTLDINRAERSTLAADLLHIYRETLLLRQRKSLSTAEGIVGKLLAKASNRSRLDLLQEYLGDKSVDGDRIQENDKIQPLAISRSKQILLIYQDWAKQQRNPEFYECLDIKQRIAGLGSIGLDRYLLLIAGKGQQQRYLLDLKEQPELQLPDQPTWPSSARRVLEVQSLRQSPVPALQGEILIDHKSFTLREMQPTQDKLKYDSKHLSKNDLQQLVQTVGQITAWSHLQTDKLAEILDYAAGDRWCSLVLTYATDYAKQVRADYKEFQKAP